MFTTLISTAELAAHLGDASFVVVDVRHDLTQPDRWGEDRYREGHIPGAVFAHVDRDLSAAKTGTNGRHPLPAPQAAAQTFSRLGIGDDKQVVVYDTGSGMSAPRLWWMLRWLGHDAVALLDGGFEKWRREGRPLSTEPPSPRRAAFTVRSTGPFVSTDDVRASLGNRSFTLIDARAPERFRGEREPIDPVAGHIPGARNRPFPQNLQADGTLKPADELRREFAALLGGVEPKSVVHMCGSGVSAGLNLLAMEVAGMPGTRLYPGSWSEWCADPSRPVERG